MAKVKVVQGFTDKNEGVFRCVGGTFSCDKARAKQLVSLELVKELKEEPAPESAKDVKPKKKATKTAKK